MTTRRSHGTGSVYREHSASTCPDPIPGPLSATGKPTTIRPDHACQGRWIGTWSTGWTRTGTRRRPKVIGKTEADARRKLVKAMRAVQSDDTGTSAHPTVKRWAEQWLEITQHKNRPSTWATNRSCVQKWIVPTIGHKRIDRLTPGDVRAVTAAIMSGGLASSSAHRAKAVLEKILRDAIREGLQVPEAALLVEGIGVGENDRDAIPMVDALALLSAAVGTPDESRWVAAWLQGMRQAECLGLTWDRIDFDAGTVDVSWQLKALPYRVKFDRSSGFRVPDGFSARQIRGSLHLVRPKTARGQRIIPLVPWMAASLLAWRTVAPANTHGLVWPRADGDPRNDLDDRTAWYALQDRAGVRHASGRYYVLHEARHSTATLLREAGVDDQTIVALLGHASILSTNAYLHISDARRREAMDAVAQRLGLTLPQIGA